MYKFMFPLLAVLVVLSLGFFTFDFGFDLVGDVPGVISYATENEFFYGYQTLTSSYSDAELSVVVNGAVGDVFVYKRAFYGVDEWTEFELESTSTGVSQEGAWNASWIRGSAEATLDVPFAEYYVAAFVCRAYDPDNVTASYPMTSSQREQFLSLFDDTAYVCGVAGFDGGALVHDKWHLDRVTCSDCVASCGSNNRTFSSSFQNWPISGSFCSSGSVSGSSVPVFPSEGSSVSWDCLGANGGDDVSCTAVRESSALVDGVCGSHNATFSAVTGGWPSGTFCDAGTSDPSSPSFPAQGSSSSWVCLGANGGDDVSCTAIRESDGGSGTTEDPYLISSCQELQDINNDLTAHYALANDIDCSGFSFDPIGAYYGSYDPSGNFVGSSNPHNEPFFGSLDGNNHMISDISITQSSGAAGLFAMLGSSTSSGVVVQDIIVSGSVSAHMTAGLLAGYAGSALISDAHTQGQVIVTDDDWPGGSSYAGGLVGLASRTTILRSSATSDVQGESRTGGLVGGTWGTTIRESYSDGSVFGKHQVGGLAGDLFSTVSTSNSYSRSRVSGEGIIGGFAGLIQFGGQLSKSYSTGSVVLTDPGSDTRSGGFLYIDQSDGLSASYWDTQSSGQSASGGGTGKTTSQMKQQSTYSGWDFTNIWAIDSAINDGYPYLRNNPPGESLSDCTPGSCTSGFICESGTCVPEPECSLSNPCSSGFSCENNVCVLDDQCTVNSDCPQAGQECQSGSCVQVGECVADNQCPSNMYCSSSNDCVCDSVSTCGEYSLGDNFCQYPGSGWNLDVFTCTRDSNGCAVTQLEQNCQWVLLEDCYYRQGEAMCLSDNPRPEVIFSNSPNGAPVTTFDISDTVYGRVIHIDSEVIEACAQVGSEPCTEGFGVLTDAALWSLGSDGYVRASWVPQEIYQSDVGQITYSFRGEGSSRTTSVTLTYTN